MDAPSGKRMAPFLPEMVAILERVGELDLTAEVRDKLCAMSAATIDRRLAGACQVVCVNGRAARDQMWAGSRPGNRISNWLSAAVQPCVLAPRDRIPRFLGSRLSRLSWKLRWRSPT